MGRRQQVSRELLRQCRHHLTNYLGILVSTAHAAEAQAPEEARPEVKQHFQQMFIELSGTLGSMTEALGEERAGNEQLAAIMERDEFKAALATQHRRLIDALYVFESHARHDSLLHPGLAAYEVDCPQHCRDFGSWLLGRFIVVDGDEFVVQAVEHPGTKPPFKRGERIRLVVLPAPPAQEEQSHDEPAAAEAAEGAT